MGSEPSTESKSAEAYVSKVVRLQTQGKPVHAAKAGIEGLTHNPENQRLLSATAEALSHQGPRKRIPVPLREAVNFVGDDWELLNNLLFLFNDGGHHALSGEALEVFWAAGGKLPSSTPWPWVNAVNGYVGLELFPEATKLARDGLAAHGHPVGYHSLASVYGHARDKQGVLDAVGDALTHDYDGFAEMRNDLELTFLAGDEDFEAAFSSVVDRRAFKANFGIYDTPAELTDLLRFHDTVGAAEYAAGFSLIATDKSHLRTWSEKPEFLDRVLLFAKADAAGSHYALWVAPGKENMSAVPVVVFGANGKASVVANSLKALLRLLGADIEPTVSSSGVAYTADPDEYDDNESEEHAAYVGWLAHQWGQTPATNPDKLVATARKKWAAQFSAWLQDHADQATTSAGAHEDLVE
ncbi:MAG: hypothetical protein JKY37_29650 [Nannocystaceae bacterium]|nr:hypothetical protein [Nannocystaceae bacterium]